MYTKRVFIYIEYAVRNSFILKITYELRVTELSDYAGPNTEYSSVEI